MDERNASIAVGQIGGMSFVISGSEDATSLLKSSSAESSEGITLTSAGGLAIQSVSDHARDLLAVSSAILHTWSEHWKSVAADVNAPDEVTVSLSLGFETTAGIWFVSGTGSGGVEISMSWSRQRSAE